MVWHKGDSYQGEFCEDSVHGQGIFTFANGDVYEGQFVNGQRHGQGRLVWSDGDCFEGQFKYGIRDGSGTYTWACGKIFQGAFKNDRPVPKADKKHGLQDADDELIRERPQPALRTQDVQCRILNELEFDTGDRDDDLGAHHHFIQPASNTNCRLFQGRKKDRTLDEHKPVEPNPDAVSRRLNRGVMPARKADFRDDGLR
eukprot:gnl/TRDRNA2_/TRDRNA2_116076_c0_seq2.p1 gnl/TRDRNA2_/TRDRNA2_116076_c0~~gnl/TRDRNA2_/TRDRNA2_116076_c0_seq2.p1  ORF type:complete len:200 (+),score=23.56 gnl/TRDRNA2_/TRDRNA2_116076_c0_seq2:33-632(+)